MKWTLLAEIITTVNRLDYRSISKSLKILRELKLNKCLYEVRGFDFF